ncbi:hypothetical protein RUND412_004098 [Rhizina undulata]
MCHQKQQRQLNSITFFSGAATRSLQQSKQQKKQEYRTNGTSTTTTNSVAEAASISQHQQFSIKQRSSEQQQAARRQAANERRDTGWGKINRKWNGQGVFFAGVACLLALSSAASVSGSSLVLASLATGSCRQPTLSRPVLL